MAQDKIKKASVSSEVSYKLPPRKSEPPKEKMRESTKKILKDAREDLTVSFKGLTPKTDITAEKDKAIEQMISRDTKIGPPSDEAVSNLKENLGKVDLEILSMIQQSGTKIVIVKAGDSILDTGLIKTVDAEKLLAEADELGKVGLKAIDEDQGTKSYLSLINLSKRISKITDNKVKIYIPQIRVTGLSTPPELADAMEELIRKQTIISLEGMVGAKTLEEAKKFMLEAGGIPAEDERFILITPEEMKEYISIVRKLNGDRIKRAQIDYYASHPDAIKEENPDRMLIDTQKNPILIPNLAYYHPPATADQICEKPLSPGTKVDVDVFFGMIMAWHSGGSTIPAGGAIKGMYFEDTNGVALMEDSTKNEKVAIHELGHAFEEILKNRDPVYYSKFDNKRDKIFQNLTLNKLISSIASENEKEFFAEGLAYFYLNPKLLKEKDEEWYNAIRDLIEHCRGVK